MAKGKRKPSKKPREFRDSDQDDPDVDSDSYYHDDVDKFHMDRDQVLLDTGAQIRTEDASSGEEEVLAYDDDSDEDDEEFEEMKHCLKQMKHQYKDDDMASDLEDDQPKDKRRDNSDKAWGSARSKFYGGHDSDIDEDLSGSEPEAAALEEQEALAIQKRLLQTLDDEDVGLDMLKSTAIQEEEEVKTAEKITKDLSKLSQREKLKLLKKQSPELLDLIADMKTRCSELQETLMPIHGLMRDKKLPSKSSGAKFVATKTHLYMNYLVNVSFYLMLKAKQIPVENHPVIRRLVQYRNLMKQMDSVESRIRPEMLSIVQKLKKGEEFPVIAEEQGEVKMKSSFKSVLLNKKVKSTKPSLEKRKRLSELAEDLDREGDDEMDKTEPSEGGSSKGRKKSRLEDLEQDRIMDDEIGDDFEGDEVGDEDVLEESEVGEDEEQQRRGINYQIEKNKGLTVKKRKELRNPRVKHRMKYRKAKIRRRGQVREVRTEMDRYGGETSGIRSGIIRSVKFR